MKDDQQAGFWEKHEPEAFMGWEVGFIHQALQLALRFQVLSSRSMHPMEIVSYTHPSFWKRYKKLPKEI